MPYFREPTVIDVAYHQLASGLEHAAHAWHKLEQQGRVPHSEVWPPPTEDTIFDSAEYHLAALLWSVKQAHDVLSGEVERINGE